MRMGALATLIIVAQIMTGCAGWADSWNMRYGPSPTIQPDNVDVTASRQMEVLRALSIRYGVPYWDYYGLTLAGFNYSDEICSFYLANLHQFERRKNRIQNTLTLATSTSTAIMNAADVSKDAVLYVTQALGFSSGWVGIVADSYLFRLSPGILSGIVQTLRNAYRTAAKPQEVNSYQMAYYKIREYYALCLPVTLEAKIEEYLASAKGTKEQSAAGVTSVTLTQGVMRTDRGVPVVTPRPQ